MAPSGAHCKRTMISRQEQKRTIMSWHVGLDFTQSTFHISSFMFPVFTSLFNNLHLYLNLSFLTLPLPSPSGHFLCHCFFRDLCVSRGMLPPISVIDAPFAPLSGVSPPAICRSELHLSTPVAAPFYQGVHVHEVVSCCIIPRYLTFSEPHTSLRFGAGHDFVSRVTRRGEP